MLRAALEVAIIGAIYLLYQLCRGHPLRRMTTAHYAHSGLWEIAQAGQNAWGSQSCPSLGLTWCGAMALAKVACANLRFRNKEMRQRIVESSSAAGELWLAAQDIQS